jgi:hypothetical protein
VLLSAYAYIVTQDEDDGEVLNALGVWHLNAAGARILHVSMRPPPGASMSNVATHLQVVLLIILTIHEVCNEALNVN